MPAAVPSKTVQRRAKSASSSLGPPGPWSALAHSKGASGARTDAHSREFPHLSSQSVDGGVEPNSFGHVVSTSATPSSHAPCSGAPPRAATRHGCTALRRVDGPGCGILLLHRRGPPLSMRGLLLYRPSGRGRLVPRGRPSGRQRVPVCCDATGPSPASAQRTSSSRASRPR
jgi:hypothetical protein